MEKDVRVTGMILSAAPAGEYDKRLVLLTKERGRITAFAKGARRPNSAFLAKTEPFSFGEFVLLPGRNTYHIRSANISQFFREIVLDYENACYGFYFLEFADYYTKEADDEEAMLRLLYLSLKAVLKPSIQTELVRYIFELKALVINGEYPQVFECCHCGKVLKEGYFSVQKAGVFCKECAKEATEGIYVSETVLYTLQYIITSPIEKLFTFAVSEEVLSVVRKIMNLYTKHYISKQFKTLSVLK